MLSLRFSLALAKLKNLPALLSSSFGHPSQRSLPSFELPPFLRPSMQKGRQHFSSSFCYPFYFCYLRPPKNQWEPYPRQNDFSSSAFGVASSLVSAFWAANFSSALELSVSRKALVASDLLSYSPPSLKR